MYDNNIKRLTKFNKYQKIIYLIFLGIPIFSILTCSGWNEGSMSVSHCLINCQIMEEFANLMYGTLLISAFLAGIPIFIYIWIIKSIANLFASEIKSDITIESKALDDQTEANKNY